MHFWRSIYRDQLTVVQLPELYTWQDLKDFVRPEAEHEFWADLQSVSNSNGLKRGCVRTQRWKEASNLYSMGELCITRVARPLTYSSEYLACASVNGRRLAIVLWDISQSPPKQLAPNPSQGAQENQRQVGSRAANTNTAPSSIPQGHTAQQQSSAYASQAVLAPSMAGLSVDPRQHQSATYYTTQNTNHTSATRRPQQSQASFYAPQASRHESPQAHSSTSRLPPEYIHSQTGTPVNVRGGYALTVSRGLFVSGINYKAREDDVKRKFSSAGTIMKCVLLTDNSSGKSKGVATVLFSSEAEAQKAVDKYDGAIWMDKKIRVRIDKETTTIAAPPRSDASPLIVNGSGAL